MNNERRKSIIGRSLPLDPPELRELDEGGLVPLLLARDPAAWREFMRRYDGSLRDQVGATLAKALRTILDSDAVEDVIGDVYLRVVEDDMRKLRFWATKRRSNYSLHRWLGLLANGIALNHIRDAFLRVCPSLDGDDPDEYQDERKKRHGADADPNRGAAWIAAERAATIGLERDQPKKRRNRKSRDDE